MTSKRKPEHQLTDKDDLDSVVHEEAGSWAPAPPEVLATRKIVKVRRKPKEGVSDQSDTTTEPKAETPKTQDKTEPTTTEPKWPTFNFSSDTNWTPSFSFSSTTSFSFPTFSSDSKSKSQDELPKPSFSWPTFKPEAKKEDSYSGISFKEPTLSWPSFTSNSPSKTSQDLSISSNTNLAHTDLTKLGEGTHETLSLTNALGANQGIWGVDIKPPKTPVTTTIAETATTEITKPSKQEVLPTGEEGETTDFKVFPVLFSHQDEDTPHPVN
eukprot:TRINITY_DN657_c0_g1_i11.p1 TRINITY_DN657_c0_g1~~TRINITY_DN657_c0_g1_i11.p1  ORF type:complete len:269 (+),score=43.92 TRINITY_DN657_c0_g1_i11:897-1703(+)